MANPGKFIRGSGSAWIFGSETGIVRICVNFMSAGPPAFMLISNFAMIESAVSKATMRKSIRESDGRLVLLLLAMRAIAAGFKFASCADEKKVSHASVCVATREKLLVVTREMIGGIVCEMMRIWSVAGEYTTWLLTAVDPVIAAGYGRLSVVLTAFGLCETRMRTGFHRFAPKAELLPSVRKNVQSME